MSFSGLDTLFMAGAYAPGVPPQRSTDCYFDCNQQSTHSTATAAANSHYGQSALKSMEGKIQSKFVVFS